MRGLAPFYHLPANDEWRATEDRTMLRRLRPSSARVPASLRRWLRFAWLERVPQLAAWLVDRLAGKGRTIAASRGGRFDRKWRNLSPGLSRMT
jgi:hypothetical protein